MSPLRNRGSDFNQQRDHMNVAEMIADRSTTTPLLIAIAQAEQHIEVRPQILYSDELTSNLEVWLNRVGLKVNPFEALDAGEDPFIPFYLIDHNQFKMISGDHPSFVFARPGSGKSAFRVRLARDCRVGRDRRKLFPLTYKMPEPSYLSSRNLGADQHFEHLACYGAQELLLYLAYHPSLVKKYDRDVLISIRQSLDWNLPLPLDVYLNQITDAGNLKPLLLSFDRTAGLLPNPPGSRDITLFSNQLSNFARPRVPKPGPKQRFDILTHLLLNKLGFEAIYILVDGVDAYVETGNDPKAGLQTIFWLLEKTTRWAADKKFLKFFLPFELLSEMRGEFDDLLTSNDRVAIIRWDADSLSEVIQQRLQEASGGRFNSLRAISTLPLRGAKLSPEEVLARQIVWLGNPNPRVLIEAVQWLFVYHLEQPGNQEKLTPEDLKAACEWIRTRRSVQIRHA